MRRAGRVLWKAGAALASLYVGVVLVAFLGQRAILFSSAPRSGREPSLSGATLLRIAGPGGSTVFALHLPAPPGAATVVHFHGTGEQLADSAALGKAFGEAGLGFYAVEYPGYGLAAGQRPSEAALYAAAECALRHLTAALKVEPARVVLAGQSLGAGVAVEMARRGLGARLALVSPFTSIAEIGERALPILPGAFLVIDRFDNAAKAPGLSLPVLIIHGTADEVVPVEMGERLGALIPGARLKLVEGAHHGDLFERPEVLPALLDFARAPADL